MKRGFWAFPSLLILLSCDGSPTGFPPSDGEVTLVAAEVAVRMSLAAATPRLHDNHNFAQRAPWTPEAQLLAQFDETSDVHVADADGEAWAQATLDGSCSMGADAGIRVGGHFSFDVLGGAVGSGQSSSQVQLSFATTFDVEIDTMRYELRFDHEASAEPGAGDRGAWWLAIRTETGEWVLDERAEDAAGSGRRSGALPPGRYMFSFALAANAYRTNRAAARSSGDTRLWFAVK